MVHATNSKARGVALNRQLNVVREVLREEVWDKVSITSPHNKHLLPVAFLPKSLLNISTTINQQQGCSQ